MAGRRGVVSREDFKNIFNSFVQKIVKNDQVVPPSDKVWIDLNSHILNKSNPKAIYTAALRWYRDYNNKQNSDESDNASDAFNDISLETDDEADFNNTTIKSTNAAPINFNIYISAEVWKGISPVPITYNRKKDLYHQGQTRKYLVLKPGVWTNVLVEKIAEHRKNIVCNVSFKRSKAYIAGNFYVLVAGSCINCAATITGFVKQQPENDSDSVKFCFSIKNFDESRHEGVTKTVKNTGVKANEIFTSSKSALQLHQRMARNTTLFEKPKGRQFTLNAIRCGKHRKKATKKLSSCPYTALLYLQAMNCWANTIHSIGISPFSVIYISPDQIRLYKAYQNRNPYTRISCDASGGFAHKLERPDGTMSSHIFLYSFTVSDEFQVSVNSNFSERNDMSHIKHWMDEWLRLGGSVPKEFIADMSAALLGAAVQAYGRKSSMSSYMNSLFNILNGKDDEKPSCFVRIDIAHFIKNVTTCSALKTARFKHKDFFIRSTALMIQMRDLTQARQHILEVLVVALSTTEGCSAETGEDTPCEQFKRSLIRKIKGINENDEEDTLISEFINLPEDLPLPEEDIIINELSGELIDYLDSVTSNFSEFINGIEKEAKQYVEGCDDGDRDNLMYNPSFAIFFRKNSKLLLMWSAICCEIFGSPYGTSSSAHSESDFKNVKLSLKHIIPCNVDVFIQNHLEMIDGAVKIASRKYLKTIEDGNSDIDVDDVDNESYMSDGADHTIPNVSCAACANNDKPSGAHKCFNCGKNVHILPGCSLSIGEEEGYGERRTCMVCSTTVKSSKPKTVESSNQQRHKTDVNSLKGNLQRSKTNNISFNDESDKIIYDELNHKETWNKKRKTKRSVYVKPSPHWDLITNINKKVKLGFLSNGNLPTTIHRVNKVPVSVYNTCAFDSLAQILAGAYAYFERYRKTCANSEDGVFEIAVLLAKNTSLKKINNMRATLLYSTYGRISCELVMTDIVRKLLKNTPSCKEISNCVNCGYSQKRMISIIGVQSDVYCDDMKRLEAGVISNFPSDIKCDCGNTLISKRQFGQHLFIELPSCRNYKASLYEESAVFKIKDVPLVLNISNHKYVLFGLALFRPPLLENGIGHYTSAIRINNKWEMYDDMRSRPYAVSANEKAVIHVLFYIKVEDSEHEASNSENSNSADHAEEDHEQSEVDDELVGDIEFVDAAAGDKEIETLDDEVATWVTDQMEDEDESFFGFEEHTDESLYFIHDLDNVKKFFERTIHE